MTTEPTSDGVLDVVSLSDPNYESNGLRSATVFSPALRHRVDCTFWSSGRTTGPLHLVILLHGVYASHWAWTALGGAHLVADALAREGSVEGFALAMPSDGLDGHGSGYVTTHAGKVESWIIDEVPRVAALAMPGVDPVASISVIGLSMGGFGALSLGAWHGGRVRAAVGMSAITRFEEMEPFVGPLDRYTIDPERRSVRNGLIRNQDQLPRLSIDCGTDDPLLDGNRRLHSELDAAGIEHRWAEHPGGHDWSYWHARLPEALRFCLDGSAPAGAAAVPVR
jgi:S-formylglutathione hydrolase FrmB